MTSINRPPRPGDYIKGTSFYYRILPGGGSVIVGRHTGTWGVTDTWYPGSVEHQSKIMFPVDATEDRATFIPTEEGERIELESRLSGPWKDHQHS